MVIFIIFRCQKQFEQIIFCVVIIFSIVIQPFIFISIINFINQLLFLNIISVFFYQYLTIYQIFLCIYLVKFSNLFIILIFNYLIFIFIFSILNNLLSSILAIFSITDKFIANIFPQLYSLCVVLALKYPIFANLVFFLAITLFLIEQFLYNKFALIPQFLFISNIYYVVISSYFLNTIYQNFLSKNYIDLMKLLILFVYLILVYILKFDFRFLILFINFYEFFIIYLLNIS